MIKFGKDKTKFRLKIIFAFLIVILIIIFSPKILKTIIGKINQSKAGCGNYNEFSVPPVTNLNYEYFYIDDGGKVAVYLKWSSPDLIGYFSGKNSCYSAKNGWSQNKDDWPISDFKYLITRNGQTPAVEEQNDEGIKNLNTGGVYIDELVASDKVITNKYQVFAFSNSGIVSMPAEITATIYPLESDNCENFGESTSGFNGFFGKISQLFNKKSDCY